MTTRFSSSLLSWGGAAALTLLAPQTAVQNASAGQFGLSVRLAAHARHAEASCVIPGPSQPAIFEDRPRTVWREPVYESRWVLVDLPAEVVTRTVPRFDRWGVLIGYDRVEEVVRPARQTWEERQVLVREGYYETVVERVCRRVPLAPHEYRLIRQAGPPVIRADFQVGKISKAPALRRVDDSRPIVRHRHPRR